MRGDPARRRRRRGRCRRRRARVPLAHQATDRRTAPGRPAPPAVPRRRATAGRTRRSASTRPRRSTRSGSSATCTSSGSPTKTSAATRSSPAGTRPPTPNAWFYERPITLEDHQQSRWIVEPILRLLDCCQESDGGVALVVTTRRARRATCRSRSVRIEAASQTPPARRRRDVRLLPRRPRRVRRGATSLGRQLYEADRARRPTTSTWR